jgi:hypothetical protein
VRQELVRTCTVDLGRWFSYAAAGAATALAASNDAEGAILYSGTLNMPVPAPNHHISSAVYGRLQLETLVGNSHRGAGSLGYLQRATVTAGTQKGVGDALFVVRSGHVAG